MRKLRGTMPPSNLFIFKEKYIYGKVTRSRFINPFRPWDPICCCNSYCKAGNSVWCGVVINWHRFNPFNLTIGIKKRHVRRNRILTIRNQLNSPFSLRFSLYGYYHIRQVDNAAGATGSLSIHRTRACIIDRQKDEGRAWDARMIFSRDRMERARGAHRLLRVAHEAREPRTSPIEIFLPG